MAGTTQAPKIRHLTKLKDLQKRLSVFGGLYILSIIAIVIISNISDSVKQSSLQEKAQLENDVNTLKIQLATLTEKIESAKEAAKLWQALNQKDHKREGLKIDDAKILLEDLQKFYYLPTQISVNLSDPVALSNLYKTTTTIVMSSNVDLKFNAPSDEILFGVIESVINNFPGFLKVKTITLDKEGDIDPKVIHQIENGTLPNLVAGTLSFKWRDFKDITQ